MTSIFGIWKRCDWCGKVSMLGLGWITLGVNEHYCTGICAKKERIGMDFDESRRLR